MVTTVSNDLLLYLQSEFRAGNVYVLLNRQEEIQYGIDEDGFIYCVLQVIKPLEHMEYFTIRELQYQNLLDVFTKVDHIKMIVPSSDEINPTMNKTYRIPSKQAMAIFLKAANKDFPSAPLWQDEKAAVIPVYVPKKWQGQNAVFQDILRTIDEPLVKANYSIRDMQYSKMLEELFVPSIARIANDITQYEYEKNLFITRTKYFPKGEFDDRFTTAILEVCEGILTMIPESNGVYMKQHRSDISTYQYGSGFAIYVNNRLTETKSLYYIHLSSFPLNAMDLNSYYEEMKLHFDQIDELFYIIFANGYVFPYIYQDDERFQEHFMQLEKQERAMFEQL